MTATTEDPGAAYNELFIKNIPQTFRDVISLYHEPSLEYITPREAQYRVFAGGHFVMEVRTCKGISTSDYAVIHNPSADPRVSMASPLQSFFHIWRPGSQYAKMRELPTGYTPESVTFLDVYQQNSLMVFDLATAIFFTRKYGKAFPGFRVFSKCFFPECADVEFRNFDERFSHILQAHEGSVCTNCLIENYTTERVARCTCTGECPDFLPLSVIDFTDAPIPADIYFHQKLPLGSYFLMIQVQATSKQLNCQEDTYAGLFKKLPNLASIPGLADLMEHAIFAPENVRALFSALLQPFSWHAIPVVARAVDFLLDSKCVPYYFTKEDLSMESKRRCASFAKNLYKIFFPNEDCLGMMANVISLMLQSVAFSKPNYHLQFVHTPSAPEEFEFDFTVPIPESPTAVAPQELSTNNVQISMTACQ